ncbi:hypothetical protein [Bradyrhizobium sp. AZCC 1578]|uniref:hypothetical protein n=1 Tax=Bradyrhizobium sp. AZCC 1578 TaxID=3117027 RepID=UPI002FEF83A1
MNISASAADDTARQVTLSRLYYVYFGLTFLGIGSALFALFCPLIVKNYASAVEYIQMESALVTKSRIGLMVTELASHYSSWWEEDGPYQMPTLLRRLGEPIDFINLGSVAIIEIFADIPDPPMDEIVSGDTESEAAMGVAGEEEFEDDFYDRRGKPDPTKIANVLHSGARYHQPFVEDFSQQASTDKHRNDILTLRYMALDNSRPMLRVFVLTFYGCGFALLLIPTAITFLQLTWHVLRH